MKKYLSLILLTMTLTSFADEVEDAYDCLNLTPAQAELVTSTSPLNCHLKEKYSEDLRAEKINLKLLTRANDNKPFISPQYKRTFVCDSCKKHFLNKLIDEKKQEFLNRKKENFLKLTYQEMSKTVSATLMDVSTLRNMFQSSNFNKSKTSCSGEKFQARLSSCSGTVKNFIANSEFTNKITSDVSSFVSPIQTKSNGFFQRGNASTCGVSEKELLMFKTLELEQRFTPDAVSKLSGISVDIDVESLEALLVKDEFAEYKQAIDSHPVLRILSKHPKVMVGVFSKAKAGKSISEVLYGNTEIDSLIDNEISKRCDQAYGTFIESVCNKDFDEGNVSLGPLTNYEKLLGDKPFKEHPESLASSDEIISDNMNLLSFCELPKDEKAPSLALTMNRINNWMPNDLDRGKSLETYTSHLYDSNIIKPMAGLCKIIENGGKCGDNKNMCGLYNLWKSKKDENSVVAKLLKTPNASVNELLRSFVSGSSKLSGNMTSTEIKTILITEGILPSDNGQFAPKTAESRPEPSQVRNIENSTVASTPTSTQAQSVSAQNATGARTHTNRLASNGFTPTASNSAAASTNDWAESSAIDRIEELSRMSDVERRKLQDTENEILRRLTDSKNASRPTKEEVSRVTRDTLKKNNQFLAPAVQNKLSEQILEDINDASTNRNVMMAPTPQQRESQANLGPATGPSKSERNWNGALAKMANAEGSTAAINKDAARSPASQNEFNTDAQPTLKVTVAKNDLKNIESILTKQLSNKVGDSFKLEIVTGASNETLTYEVKKSANGLVVSPLGTSAIARQYLDSVQKVVNKLYIQQSQPRMASRQALLQTLGARTPSQN